MSTATANSNKKGTTSFAQLATGEILGETQVYKVEKVQGGQVQLATQTGESIVVDQGYVERYLTSANQYSSTETITRTEAAEKLLSNPGVVMTVSFNKQVKPEDVVKTVMASYASSTPVAFEKALSAAVKSGMKGEERIIRGFHWGELNEFGRINFSDQELYNASNPVASQRQLDPRTINWMILRGVMYKVKK